MYYNRCYYILYSEYRIEKALCLIIIVYYLWRKKMKFGRKP